MAGQPVNACYHPCCHINLICQNQGSASCSSLLPPDLVCSFSWHCFTLSSLTPRLAIKKWNLCNTCSYIMFWANAHAYACPALANSCHHLWRNTLSWVGATRLLICDYGGAVKVQILLLAHYQVLHMQEWWKSSCNEVNLLYLLLSHVGQRTWNVATRGERNCRD